MDGRPMLAATQRLVLDAIIASVRYRGFPPSVREIMRAAGLSSTSTVAHHLRQLEWKGYIERVPDSPRAIRIVE